MTADVISGATAAEVASPPREPAWYGRAFFLLVGVGMALWLVPMRSSLWLDETGTWWVIKDGFAPALERAWEIQGQSPLYYLIALAASKVGSTEVVLRLPSLLFATLAAWGFWRVASDWLERDAARLATIFFVTAESVAFVAADARPYALALAASIGALVALTRLLRAPSARSIAAYVLLSVLTVYAHYVFVLTFCVHVAVYVAERRRGVEARPHHLVVAAGIGGVLLLPLAGQLVSLARRGETLSYAGDPSPGVLVLPPLVLGIGWIVGRVGRSIAGDERRAALVALTWALGPPLIIFLVSWLTPLKFFTPRYYVSASPGLALLAGWAVGRLPARHLRLATAMVIVGVAAVMVSSSHGNEGWREAARDVQRRNVAGAPVLLRSGFIEGEQLRALEDPTLRSFLQAPAFYYPVAGPVVNLPYDTGGARSEVARDIARRVAGDAERFFLLTNYGDPFRRLIAADLASSFRSEQVGIYGSIRVVEFRRIS